MAIVAAAALPAGGVPPSQSAIAKACDQVDTAAQCERLLETEQLKQFPGVAVRDGTVLRVPGRPRTAPLEFRDSGKPDDDAGTPYVSHAFWDFWRQRNSAVISVLTHTGEHYLVVDVESGLQLKVPAEPLLSPDGQRFVVADLCEKQCTNQIQVWRFDRDRPVRERSLRPSEKWYEADVTWRDAATLAIEYSVAAPRRRLADAGELELIRAKPRLLKLSDSEWSSDERRR